MCNWTHFAEIVRANRRFLLTTHVRPDGDALGSELAMALILEALGKEVRIVNAHPTPPNVTFIDPASRIEVLAEDTPATEFDGFDVLMVLDTGAWIQLGRMAPVVREFQGLKVVVDHHRSQDDLGAEVFRDVAAEATGQLVAKAAGQLGVEINEAMATPLFVAVATDTGWFRFSSVTGDTYRLVGTLIDAGVRPDRVYAELYERESVGRLRLVGRVLGRVQTELDGRLIHTHVMQDDFQATGALPSDTENIINMTLSVGGTEAAVFFGEKPGGGFKVSFRGRDSLDCCALAEQFGGGGHKAAAGATIAGPLESVRARVLDAMRAAMQ
ncbi:MAG: DHH family phosphoesterase [Planctomycetes bacterium]|nr:DHH family phosphoesterase [Planctomycetota bacterium]